MRYEKIILGQIRCEEAPQVVPAWYKECLNIWAYEFEYWLVNILKFAVLIIAAKVNLLKSEPKFA